MLSILIVDDTEELAQIYKDVTERAMKEPCSVEIAGSSESAIREIERLKDENRSFDLIVTDLRMTHSYEGLRVLEAAREADCSTQVIAVTAYMIPEIALKVMSLGAFDCLQRNSSGFDLYQILPFKMKLAIQFRRALLRQSTPSTS